MRLLPTLLLTTTIFSTNLFASEMVKATPAAGPSASASTTATTAITIAPNVKAQINALNALFSSTSRFNVSDAAEIYFSPDLFPYISWRSPQRNFLVVYYVSKAIGDAVRTSNNRNTMLTSNALRSIMFPDCLGKQSYTTPPL